jgi:hypothetical protein
MALMEAFALDGCNYSGLRFPPSKSRRSFLPPSIPVVDSVTSEIEAMAGAAESEYLVPVLQPAGETPANWRKVRVVRTCRSSEPTSDFDPTRTLITARSMPE